MFIDLEAPPMPDAIMRIKQRHTEKKQARLEKKIFMVKQLDLSREEVLAEYDMKTIH